MMRQGAYAEYAVVGASEVAPKPAGVDHATAAAVPLAGLAAWQSLELLDLMAGQTILIQGAAGGVGTFAVQFAVQRGAHVIATAAADKHELLRELGVVEPINYGTIRFEEVVHGVDAVLDLVGGEVLARSLTVLKPGGMLVTTAGQPDVAAAAARGVRAQGIQTYADPAQLAEIGSLIVTGAVKPIISDVFPLAGARHAHELADRGHARGKIVLRMV
jgi:NADPH:quinone reductase-like Zn-dependent oxidoreductase